MNKSLSNKIASPWFRRALLLGLIGALITEIMVVNTVTTTNLGTTNLRLAGETFVSDTDVTIAPSGFGLGNDDTAVGATQVTATEMETGITGKYANTALPKDNYTYSVLVQEAADTSFQPGEVYKVEVYGGNSTSNILLGTVYCKQDAVDDGAIEGCEVVVDQQSATTTFDSFDVIVTQVA